MTEDPIETDALDTTFEIARQADAAGDAAAAEAGFRRVIAEATDARHDRILRARAFACLAALCRYDGRLDEADTHARAAFDLALEIDDAAIVSATASELAQVDLEFGRLDAARDRAELAVVNALTIPEPRSRDAATALALQARAAVWRQVGDLRMAEGDLLEAQRRAKSGFGPESLELASVLSDLGVVRKFSGDFERSAIAHRRAGGIISRVGGPDHPDLATVEHNLGGVEFSRGHYAAAIDHGRRSVEIHARTLGDDHLTTALDRVALAASLDRASQRDEAQAMLLDTLPILEARLGSSHREVAVAYNNLAAIAHRDGDLARAEVWYRRSLKIKAGAIGPDAPSMANTLVNLAGVRRSQGDLDETERLLRLAIEILEPAVEPTHPTLEIARRHLARAEAERGS